MSTRGRAILAICSGLVACAGFASGAIHDRTGATADHLPVDGGSLKNRLEEKSLTSLFSSGLPIRNVDPDYGKSVEYLVTSKGYPFERHYATTEDGYIIEMHRIPHGRHPHTLKGTAPKPNRKVALVGVPLLTESTIWVMDFPNNSLAFILADRGFDVWLTNIRGSSFGKHHTNLTTYDSKFWQYTFIDIGTKDLPAQIDYALKVTGREQVFYTGLSQGAASAFAMLAKRPEYNRKLRAMAALGAFRRTCHINIWWLNYGSSFETYLGRVPIVEVMPKVSMMDRVCDSADKLCIWYTQTFLHTGTKYLNLTRIPVYMNHFPSGTSKMNLFYYSQLMQEDQCTTHWNEVREYDFDRAPASRWARQAFGSGLLRTAEAATRDNAESRQGRLLWGVFGESRKMNPVMYDGSMEPPILDAGNIHVPIKLYWSDGDRYAPPSEQEFLKQEIKSIVAEYHIADPEFGHYSFFTSPYNSSVFTDIADYFDDCSRAEEYCTYRPSESAS